MARTKGKVGQVPERKKGGFRDYQTTLIIGGKGQGKSTWLSDAIREYLRTFGPVYKSQGIQPRVFVHDMSGSRAFQHIPTVQMAVERLQLQLEHPLDLLTLKDKSGQPVWQNGALRYVCNRNKEIEHMYGILSSHFRNGMLVYDEWTTYVRANPPDWQIEIVNNHRNYGIELFLVCHQILKVPPFFVRGDMVANIVLFKTGEKNITFKDIQRKYSCADDLWEAYQRVMSAPETDNFIQYHEIIQV